MATNSVDTSDDIRQQTQQSPLASQRAKENNAGAEKSETTASSGWFPLGYKDGFSQWWSSTTPSNAEHRVLSYIPYLKENTNFSEHDLPEHERHTSCRSRHQEGATATKSENLAAQDQAQTDPYGSRIWSSKLVELNGKNRKLNEFSVEREGEEVKENLVILHGYGAGLAFFYKNFEPLSRPPGWKLYALDLLGMGRSSRPPFRIQAKDKQERITEAENWFIDALEEWRVKKKIDQFTLIGHSLGGYMSVAYALKYPGRLKKLILASPVGIPEDPYAVEADLPDPNDSTLANEFTQEESEIASAAAGPAMSNKPGAVQSSANGAKPTDANQPPRRQLPKWFKYLWDANVSPFSVVRWAGPLGPRLVSGWTSRRFSHLPPEEGQALHDYSYSLFRQPGSGEYALGYILAPGAFARRPLITRIHGVGRQLLVPHSAPIPDDMVPPTKSSSMQSSAASTQETASTINSQAGSAAQPKSDAVRETGIPVVLMYGDHDWMDVAGGFAAEIKLNAERDRAIAENGEAYRAKDGGSAKVVIIKNAGHHLYLEGADEFNECIRKEMRDVEQRSTR